MIARSLPAPRNAASPLLRAIRDHLVLRERRACHFEKDLFGEPAWDMLLDLALARLEGRQVQVTSLYIASRVPTGTAHRHIRLLERAGLIERSPDSQDRRRVWLAITDAGYNRVVALFDPAAGVALAAFGSDLGCRRHSAGGSEALASSFHETGITQ